MALKDRRQPAQRDVIHTICNDRELNQPVVDAILQSICQEHWLKQMAPR
jgi:hypothetical protein